MVPTRRVSVLSGTDATGSLLVASLRTCHAAACHNMSAPDRLDTCYYCSGAQKQSAGGEQRERRGHWVLCGVACGRAQQGGVGCTRTPRPSGTGAWQCYLSLVLHQAISTRGITALL